MNDITKIKVDGDPESSYQLYPRNNEFAKRAAAVMVVLMSSPTGTRMMTRSLTM